MTKNTQRIMADFDDFDGFFENHAPGIVAESATEYYKERFIRKNWEGQPWPKYNYYNKPNRREPTRGSLMMRNNLLFQSIRPAVVMPGRVTITAGSTRAPYARVHNEGLPVRASQYVRPYTNRNFMGRGQSVQVKGHSRRLDFKMPRRQFMGPGIGVSARVRSRMVIAYNDRIRRR